MCSTKVPKRRRSTRPTRKPGSSVRVAAVTSTLYNVVCIVVNPSRRPPGRSTLEGDGAVADQPRGCGREGRADPTAGRGRPGRRLGEDREQRGERLRAR